MSLSLHEQYMNKNCARSCGTCGKITKTAQTKTKSETIIPDYIPNDQELQNAAEKFGEKQAMSGLEASRTLEVIQRSIKYMASDQVMTLPETYRANCRNKNELCSFWAGYGRAFLLSLHECRRYVPNIQLLFHCILGECNANEAYMKVNCAPACMTCHLIE